MKENRTQNDFAGSLAFGAAASFVVGFVLGANQARIKAFLGYHFPHIFVLGNKQKRSKGVEPTAEELLAIADDIIQASLRGKPAGNCLIANVDQEGAPRVRPINPMTVSLCGDENKKKPKAIFFTNRRSRKYQQFKSDPRAELVYFDPMGISSVRLAGTVQEMSHDDAKSMWKPRMQGFVQEGPQDGGRYTTYEFHFHRIEVVSMRHGLATTERQDWAPYTLLRDEKQNEWIYQKTTPEQQVPDL